MAFLSTYVPKYSLVLGESHVYIERISFLFTRELVGLGFHISFEDRFIYILNARFSVDLKRVKVWQE